jgi:hypothetical protein
VLRETKYDCVPHVSSPRMIVCQLGDLSGPNEIKL